MNRTTWNVKPGTNSYGDGIAQMLIGARVKDHVFNLYPHLILECAYENLRRLDRATT
jgi:hypothetical protein